MRLTTDGDDSSVMNTWPDNSSCMQRLTQNWPITGLLAQKDQRRRLEPRRDLSECLVECTGRSIDFRVSHDPDKFVDTWPRNGPWSERIGQFLDDFGRLWMIRRIASMGVDQEVGVDGDQAPRPS